MKTEILRVKARKTHLEYLEGLKNLQTTRSEQSRRADIYRQKERTFWREVSRAPSLSSNSNQRVSAHYNSEQLGRFYRLQSDLKVASESRRIIGREVQQKFLNVQSSKRRLDFVEEKLKDAVLSGKRKIGEMLAEEGQSQALASKIRDMKGPQRNSGSMRQQEIRSPSYPEQLCMKQTFLATMESPLTTNSMNVSLPQYTRGESPVRALSSSSATESKAKSVRVFGSDGALKGVSVLITKDSHHNIHVAVGLPPHGDASGRGFVDKLVIASKLAQLGVHIASLKFESGASSSDNAPLEYKRRKRTGEDPYDES